MDYLQIDSNVAVVDRLSDNEILGRLLGDKDPESEPEDAPIMYVCEVPQHTAKKANDALKVLEDICLASCNTLRRLRHLDKLKKIVLSAQIPRTKQAKITSSFKK